MTTQGLIALFMVVGALGYAIGESVGEAGPGILAGLVIAGFVAAIRKGRQRPGPRIVR